MSEPRKTRMQVAEDLISYFGNDVLRNNIEYIPGETIIDTAVFLQIHFAALRTLPAKSIIWRLTYLRVYNLKQFLENEKNKL